jgi:hypothetical protein
MGGAAHQQALNFGGDLEFYRQPSAFNGQRHATVSALIGIKPAAIARRLEIRELLGAMKSSREYG